MAARNANLEAREDELLLAIKGLTPNLRRRIAGLADRLQVQHHSAIEPVNRLEKKSLVYWEPGTIVRREAHEADREQREYHFRVEASHFEILDWA